MLLISTGRIPWQCRWLNDGDDATQGDKLTLSTVELTPLVFFSFLLLLFFFLCFFRHRKSSHFFFLSHRSRGADELQHGRKNDDTKAKIGTEALRVVTQKKRNKQVRAGMVERDLPTVRQVILRDHRAIISFIKDREMSELLLLLLKERVYLGILKRWF